MYKFSCPHNAEGCPKRFRSQSGRTYHVRSAHNNNHNIIHTQKKKEGLRVGPEIENFLDNNFNDAPPSLAEHDDVHPPTPELPTQLATGNSISFTTAQRNIHPHINGIFYLLFSFFY